jgi:hypothetical protein
MYKVTKLISSKLGEAKTLDSSLQNVFVIHKDSDLSLIWTPGVEQDSSAVVFKSYTLDGVLLNKLFLGADNPSFTDMAINKTQGFVIKNGNESAAGTIFSVGDSDDSYLIGYNKWLSGLVEVDPDVDNIITGFAFKDKYLYTAQKTIVVYDFNFKKVDNFNFPRTNIPNEYIPINIKVIDDLVYIVYRPNTDTKGGIVNIHNLDGTFIKTLINDPNLNKPWGIVKSNSKFGKYKCNYMIGNEEDGTISIYNKHGVYLGKLKDDDKKDIVLLGIRSMQFKNYRLYFAQTISGQNDDISVLGYISPSKHC